MSGALFIVLEDVLRIVKQTNNSRVASNLHGKGVAVSTNVHISPLKSSSPKGIEKDDVLKAVSTDLIDFIPVGSPPTGRLKDTDFGKIQKEEKGDDNGKEKEKCSENDKDGDKEKKKEKDTLKERRKKTTKNLEKENTNEKENINENKNKIENENDDDLDSETERNLFRQERDRKQSINHQFQMEWNEKDDGQYDQEISTKSELHTYASYARKKGKKCLSRPPSIATDFSIGMLGLEMNTTRMH